MVTTRIAVAIAIVFAVVRAFNDRFDLADLLSSTLSKLWAETLSYQILLAAVLVGLMVVSFVRKTGARPVQEVLALAAVVALLLYYALALVAGTRPLGFGYSLGKSEQLADFENLIFLALPLAASVLLLPSSRLAVRGWRLLVLGVLVLAVHVLLLFCFLPNSIHTAKELTGAWRPVEFQDLNQRVVPPEDHKLGLWVGDGRIGGFDGCNRFSADLLTCQSRRMKAGHMISTMVDCLGGDRNVMDEEGLFQEAIWFADHYRVRNDTLWLRSRVGAYAILHRVK